MPSYQRFSSGSVSSGGTSARLTASTNARKTVRATKEILNVEDEEEGTKSRLLRGCYK